MTTRVAVVLVAALVLLAGLVGTVLLAVLRAVRRPQSPVARDRFEGSASADAELAELTRERSRATEELQAAEREHAAAGAALGQARSDAADLIRSAETESARTRETTEIDAARMREAAESAAAELSSARQQLAATRTRLDTLQADLDARQRSAGEQEAQRADEAQRRESRLDGERSRLDGEQARLDGEQTRLDGDVARLTARVAVVEAHQDDLAERERALLAATAEHTSELERIAGLTADAARREVLTAAEADSRRAAAILARDIEAAARRSADRTARMVVTSAIQRVASEQTAESVVSTVSLPAEEMKGRIIGREGRNIRTFEQVTGVNVIIDDTPDTVVLSCFDPVRREVARVTLNALVADGRIHPHRIEETYASAQREIAALCRRAADDALADVGITDLHPALVEVVGRLRFRTSYGQNVLLHSVEAAHLAGVMAAELGLDTALLRRCAFLHDIGKALTHEAQGSHATVGAELARRHGEHLEVVHAIEAHHNEVEPRTVEALLTQAADAISGGRPGARRESLEAYVTRLTRLEEIGLAHPGVEKVFAMQAGREVKVMVVPDLVDDLGAQVLAREIVKQVEDELTYPGQIRVTVVRESRATEIAR